MASVSKASSLSVEEYIYELRDEYDGTSSVSDRCVVKVTAPCDINGFIGSYNLVDLSCREKIAISIEAPACIAAPFVYMRSQEGIKLGMRGIGKEPVPVRLFVTEKLIISTKHLSVGKIMFLAVPEEGEIYCKKLALSKSTDSDVKNFEIIKSWIKSDDTEIETVQKEDEDIIISL